MDNATLVAPDVDEGRKFLDLLKDAGIPVKAALWQKSEVLGKWELCIVTPLVEELGVRGTYDRLDRILSKTPQRPAVNLLNVTVLTPKAWFYKSLRRVLRNTRDQFVTKQPVGDQLLHESFIYFVK